MVIHKVNSKEEKGDQHFRMLHDCKYHLRRVNNSKFISYSDIMNMKTIRINYEQNLSVAETYHFKPNKW